MSTSSLAGDAGPATAAAETTAFRIIFAISVCHLLNDMMQSAAPPARRSARWPLPWWWCAGASPASPPSPL